MVLVKFYKNGAEINKIYENHTLLIILKNKQGNSSELFVITSAK